MPCGLAPFSPMRSNFLFRLSRPPSRKRYLKASSQQLRINCYRIGFRRLSSAMSKHASPTAQLLRNSRLFSLPQALPRPIIEQHIRENYHRSSDSATTPYPLRQAIITPNSSGHRGDWGLKRSLPKRNANKSSTPTQTVIANDAYEGITDYRSASPHVKTLEKFQELSYGMTRGDQKPGVSNGVLSALDEEYDFTDKGTTPSAQNVIGIRGSNKRWKYAASATRSMTPGEFKDYIGGKVRHRKDEFMHWLRARHHRKLLEDVTSQEESEMQSSDQTFDSESVAAKTAFVNWLKSMPSARLVEYLERQNAGLTPALASKTASMEPISKIDYDEQQANPIAKSFGGNPAFTFSAKIKSALKQQWRTAELDEEDSHHADLLRKQLSDLPEPAVNLPTPAYPSLNDHHAATWLKFLGVARKYEDDFLRAWSTHEWDPEHQHWKEYLIYLRAQNELSSELNNLIREFLDMPPMQLTGIKERYKGFLAPQSASFNLSTHPTAGLSYLRTNNILHNHPLLGPQQYAPPVKARVVSTMGDKVIYGLAGFAGVGNPDQDGRLDMGFEVRGGAKTNRHIKKVFVDGEGKIIVGSERHQSQDSVDIRDGALEQNSEVREAAERRALGVAQPTSNIAEVLRASGRRRPFERAKPLENKTVDKLKEMQQSIDLASGFKPR